MRQVENTKRYDCYATNVFKEILYISNAIIADIWVFYTIGEKA